MLLSCYRKRWKGDVFGSSEEDDVDALFSIYSKYLVYRTEGDNCVTCSCVMCCVTVRRGVAMHDTSQTQSV